MKSPILGQAYKLKYLVAACDTMINLYPESIKTDGKETGVLIRAQGLRTYCALGANAEVRGLWKGSNERGYAVVGNQAYTVRMGVLSPVYQSSGAVFNLDTSTGLVDMRDNGSQLIIVDGTAMYVVTFSTGFIQRVTNPNAPNGATTVVQVDGYFIACVPGSNQYKISALYDGLTWDALDFASAEGDPDNLVSILESHREVKLFGTKTTETVVNSGDANFPFNRPGGAIIDHGIAAARSASRVNNTVVFLGCDERGTGIVYQITGLSSSQRISDHAVEQAIANWTRIDDAFAVSWQDDGHSFYMLTSPSSNESWVYDFATNLWHQRGYWDGEQFIRHRANCHMFYDNRHLVGDYENGKIYELTSDVYDDDGTVQVCERTWRQPNAENKRITYMHLVLDVQLGQGLDGGVFGSDPVVGLEYSNDGGQTWSNQAFASLGQIGEYTARCQFWRLGSGRDRVWRMRVSDPVPFAVVGAYVEARLNNA